MRTERRNGGAGSLADDLLVVMFARLDPLALGASVGLVSGLVVAGATIVLLVKGGDPVGPTLSLLGNYCPGYTVTWAGSLVGFVYGFASGFALGGLLALGRNALLRAYLKFLQLDASFVAVVETIDGERTD